MTSSLMSPTTSLRTESSSTETSGTQVAFGFLGDLTAWLTDRLRHLGTPRTTKLWPKESTESSTTIGNLKFFRAPLQTSWFQFCHHTMPKEVFSWHKHHNSWNTFSFRVLWRKLILKKKSVCLITKPFNEDLNVQIPFKYGHHVDRRREMIRQAL